MQNAMLRTKRTNLHKGIGGPQKDAFELLKENAADNKKFQERNDFGSEAGFYSKYGEETLDEVALLPNAVPGAITPKKPAKKCCASGLKNVYNRVIVSNYRPKDAVGASQVEESKSLGAKKNSNSGLT